MRSNRGDEYFGRYDETYRNQGPFTKFLEQEGIIAQYMMLGTPGLTVRRNKTLMNIVRSMVSNMNLPESLWGEAHKTTVYILNKVPNIAAHKTITTPLRGSCTSRCSA